MALKRTITKSVYEKLSDELKAEYVENGDVYTLDVEGIEDVDELRRARDREKETAKQLKAELKAVQTKLAELEGDDDRKRGDVDKIDSAWKAKLAEREAELTEALSKKDSYIKRTMIQAAAEKLAAEISTAPKIMMRHIEERLSVEFNDEGEPSLVVLGEDGKPVKGASLDNLKKEFMGNKDYAPIIIGSKGSGGGAPKQVPGKQSGGAGGSGGDVDLSKLSPKEMVEYLKEKRQNAEQ